MNLKTGEHNFHYRIEPEFFSYFKNSLLEPGEADVDVLLFKQDECLFTLDISFSARLNLNCDRCLSVFTFPFSATHKYILKIVNSVKACPSEDDIFYVSAEEDHINIASSVYELMSLHIPLKKTCELVGSDCDKEMIEQINKLKNNKPVKEADPRWDSLKNLISN